MLKTCTIVTRSTLFPSKIYRETFVPILKPRLKSYFAFIFAKFRSYPAMIVVDLPNLLA